MNPSYDKFFDNPVWLPAEKVHNWACYVSAYVIRPALKAAFRYEVHGEEKIPKGTDEALVFACNHMSYGDPLIMWCVLYRYGGGGRFLARSSLFRPFIGGFIARAGAIPVDPDSADRTAVKRAAACLKRGEHLLIFPEGTRMNRPDKEYHPHAGVILIASMGKARIVPVGISNTDQIMPYGKPKFLRFPKVHINIGDPIDVKDEKFADLPKKERTGKILDHVMDEVFRLRDAYQKGKAAAREEI